MLSRFSRRRKSITGEGKRNVPAFPGLWHQAGTFPILWSDILNVFIGNWDGRTQFQVEKGKFRWDFGKEFPDSLEFSQAPLERVLTGIIPAHGMGMGWDLRPLNPKPFHNSLFGIFPVFPTKKILEKKNPARISGSRWSSPISPAQLQDNIPSIFAPGNEEVPKEPRRGRKISGRNNPNTPGTGICARPSPWR